MENAQLPKTPHQETSTTSPSNAADNLNLPPGTFEYVDKKINWKKFLEITGLVIIIAVPLVLSLNRINYTFTRNYQTVSPSDVGPLPSDYQIWGSFISATKKIFVPANVSTPAPTQTHPTSTPVPNTSQPQNQNNNSTQIPGQIVYPTGTYPTNTPTPIPTATITPIPTLTPVPSPTPNTTGVNPAIVACYGKYNDSKCSYQANGDQIEGRCNYSGGFYMCVSH
jgi:hypothetical protein